MAVTIQAPKGTEDVLGSESYKWQFIENLANKPPRCTVFRNSAPPLLKAWRCSAAV